MPIFVLIYALFLVVAAACGASPEVDDSEEVQAPIVEVGDTAAIEDDAHDSSQDTRQGVEVSEPEVESAAGDLAWEGEAWVEENFSNPLALWVHVELERSARVRVAAWSGGELVWESAWAAPAKVTRVPVLGLAPGSALTLEISLREPGREDALLWRSLDAQGGQLSSSLPSIVTAQAGVAAPSPGLTFFGPRTRAEEPESSWPFYLAVNAQGVPLWSYQDEALEHSGVARDVRLLDSGDLMVLLGQGVRIINIYGELVHEWLDGALMSEPYHHDALVLPSGNLLMIGREERELTVERLEGIHMVMGDTLSELTPQGEVVWSWSSFEHLDTERLPGPLSRVPNAQGGHLDWTHANGLAYDIVDDSVLVSLRHQNQVIRVARGNGQVTQRIGAGGDYPLLSGDWFYSQHSPELDGEGGLLLYDNGNERPGDGAQGLLPKDERESRAVRYVLDADTGEVEETWSYTVPEFTAFLGGVSRLENGNVLVCAGGLRGAQSSKLARLLEVTPDANAEVVWSLEMEAFIYRARRFTWDQLLP